MIAPNPLKDFCLKNLQKRDLLFLDIIEITIDIGSKSTEYNKTIPKSSTTNRAVWNKCKNHVKNKWPW